MALNDPASSASGRAPVTRGVRLFRLLGAFASLGLSVNAVVCLVRRSWFDTPALIPFAILLPMLALAVWVCRSEFIASFRSHRIRVAFNVMLQAAAAFLILAGLLYAFGRRFHTKFDGTTHRLYELSEETLLALRRLAGTTEPVEAILLEAGTYEDPRVRASRFRLRARIRKLLEEYQSQAERVQRGTFRFTTLRMLEEPARLSALARRSGIKRFSAEDFDSVLLLRGARSRLLRWNEMLRASAFLPDGRPLRRSFQGERAVTSALHSLLEEKRRAVYFTAGHGEREEKDLAQFLETLRRQNFAARTLSRLDGADVPDNAVLVVIAGPRKPFRSGATRRLRSYLERGGRLLVLADAVLPAVPGQAQAASGLQPLLAEYGLRLRQDLVTRSLRPAVLGNPIPEKMILGWPPPPSPNQPSLLRALRASRQGVVFGLPCAVQTGKPSRAGYRAKVLLQTEPYRTRQRQTWADPVNLPQARSEAGAGSLKGPVPLAACSFEGQANGTANGAKILVLAESRPAGNTFFFPNAGNRLFLVAALRWLAGEDEWARSIPPKDPEVPLAKFSLEERDVLVVLLVLGLPLAMVFVGVVVWAVRQH